MEHTKKSLRFKTREEFEKQYGPDWKNKLAIHWNHNGGMDYLFGQPHDGSEILDSYIDGHLWRWGISEDMLTIDPLPGKIGISSYEEEQIVLNQEN